MSRPPAVRRPETLRRRPGGRAWGVGALAAAGLIAFVLLRGQGGRAPDASPSGPTEAAGDGPAAATAWRERAETHFARGMALIERAGPGPRWREAAGAFGQAAEAFGRAGDRIGYGESLHMKGVALQPTNDPEGDWAKARAALAEAAAVFRERGASERLADALFEEAWCLQPDNDPGVRDWTRPRSLYEESERLAAGSSARGGVRHADAVYQQGWCLQPDNGPEGDWAGAIERYRAAMELYLALGDLSGEADAARQIGRCLLPARNPGGNLALALDHLERAARRQRELGRRDAEFLLLEEFAAAARPDRTEGGSWARAADAYARMEEVLEDDVVRRAWALFDRARCLSEGDWTRAGDEARALVGRAVGLLREHDEADLAAYMEATLE